MAINRLANSTISVRSTLALPDPPATNSAPFLTNGKTRPLLRSGRAVHAFAHELESFEARNVDDEDDGSADLDFEILGHIEQTWFQSGGIRHRDLGAAATGPAE